MDHKVPCLATPIQLSQVDDRSSNHRSRAVKVRRVYYQKGCSALTSSLNFRKGVRTRQIAGYDSLALVAALGAGVLATLLQITYTDKSVTGRLASGCLLISLLLSLATGIISQIVNFGIVSGTVMHATGAYPKVEQKGTHLPILCFILSVLTMLMGTTALAFTTFSGTIIPWVTVATIAVIGSFGLLACFWYVSEAKAMYVSLKARAIWAISPIMSPLKKPIVSFTSRYPNLSYRGLSRSSGENFGGAAKAESSPSSRARSANPV